VFTSSSSATAVAGKASSITVTASGVPAPAIAVDGSLPAGVTFTANSNGTATLAGTPGATAGGVYPLTFTATNSTGATIQSFILRVLANPTITSATSAIARVGSSFHLTVKATGNPIPVVAESGKLPKGLKWTENGTGTATLAGTPRAHQGGLYHLRFVASSSIGTVTEAFRLTVAQAPAVTSRRSAKAVHGYAFSFTFKSTGYPMATITRSGSVKGMTFTARSNGTGTLSGIPTKAGTYRLAIRAKNSVGSATQRFTLTVG
jgi:hypothetical protein